MRLPRIYCSFIARLDFAYTHSSNSRAVFYGVHNFTIINPWCAYARGLYSSCVSVCPSTGANLGTGTSSRLQQYRCNAMDKASVHTLHHKSALCLSAFAMRSRVVGHAFTRR